MITTAEMRETTNNDSAAVIKLGHTVSAPNLIKDMQDYCNKGTSKDIILKRLTDNYNALSSENNSTNIALLCSKIAIDNYLLANLVSTISIQK